MLSIVRAGFSVRPAARTRRRTPPPYISSLPQTALRRNRGTAGKGSYRTSARPGSAVSLASVHDPQALGEVTNDPQPSEDQSSFKGDKHFHSFIIFPPISPNDLADSVERRDAYLYMPIHPNSRDRLGIFIGKRRCLPSSGVTLRLVTSPAGFYPTNVGGGGLPERSRPPLQCIFRGTCYGLFGRAGTPCQAPLPAGIEFV